MEAAPIEPRGDLGRGQGAVSEELGRVEDVGEAGRDRLVRSDPGLFAGVFACLGRQPYT